MISLLSFLYFYRPPAKSGNRAQPRFRTAILIGTVLDLVHPRRGDPLRLPLDQVDLPEELLVGALRVGVDDDHVEEVAVGLLHLAGALDDVLQLLVVGRLGALQLPPLQLLQRRRRHEHDEGHQVRGLEDAQALRVEVEHADPLREDDGADGLEGGAVVGLFVLAVLDELAGEDVLLEGGPGDEVVVLTVDLVVALRPGGVCNEKT